MRIAGTDAVGKKNSVTLVGILSHRNRRLSDTLIDNQIGTRRSHRYKNELLNQL